MTVCKQCFLGDAISLPPPPSTLLCFIQARVASNGDTHTHSITDTHTYTCTHKIINQKLFILSLQHKLCTNLISQTDLK